MMPDIKFTKSGYEIRADILKLASEQADAAFNAKFQGWQISSKRDDKTGQLVTNVEMPKYPGIDHVLEAAEKMYAFVTAKR